MKTYYTIYKITNNLNNKFYIGMHQTTDLDDGYYGSGQNIKRAIKKYGIENFTKEYLSVFDNNAEMIDLEIKLVNEDFVRRDDVYNIAIGGEGGFHRFKESASEIGKRGQIGLCRKMEEDSEFREKCRQCSSETAKKMWKLGKWKSYDWTGRQHSDKTKQILSEKHTGLHSGVKNEMYGKTWVSNIKKRVSYVIDAKELDAVLEDVDVIHKRILDFDLYFSNEEKKKQRDRRKLEKNEERTQLAISLLEEYKRLGYHSMRKFCKDGHYTYSRESLYILWQTHIPNFSAKTI